MFNFDTRLKNLRIMVLLGLVGLTACHAQPPSLTIEQANQAISGEWKNTSHKSCALSLQFKDDGTMTYQSGSKTITSVYVLTPQEGSEFLRLKYQVVAMSGENTCAGDADWKVNQRALNFIKFKSNRSEILFCKEENDQSCQTPFQRVR